MGSRRGLGSGVFVALGAWLACFALAGCSGESAETTRASGGKGGGAGAGGGSGDPGVAARGGSAGSSAGTTSGAGQGGSGGGSGDGGSMVAGAGGEDGPTHLEPVPSDPLPEEDALDDRFVKITLHREFVAEGASFGDFNRDGVRDVVAGPDWYEGPGYGSRHAIWPRTVFDVHGYSDCFFEWVRDFNGDGWDDVLMVGFPGYPGAWFENPRALDVPWPRHDVIQTAIDNESPEFFDLTGDGEPELVHMTGGVFGWSSPDAGASEPWVFHALSEPVGYGAFTHGLGVGDLDGDGRPDALEASGYYQQPKELAGDPLWQRREQVFGGGGGQMPVADLDGDGDADVVATYQAHGYGLSWYEQTASDPAPTFQEHAIVSKAEPVDDAAVIMHEPHAVSVTDLDGDDVLDIVTGERFWGHIPGGTPDVNGPARLYWFRGSRTASGVEFHPTLIDDDSGIGTQLTVGDGNGDGQPDVVIANKKGAFVFLQKPPLQQL